MRYTEKWVKRLEGDYQFINRKLVKASYLLDEIQRNELIEALTTIGNAVNGLAMRIASEKAE